jgi:hypothetical protein
MDYKTPFVNLKELTENYEKKNYIPTIKGASNILKATRYIHSILEGNQNFIHP